MTLIACGLLDRHLRTSDRVRPCDLLSALHKDLQSLLGQDEKNSDTDDGLELGVCLIDKENCELTFSGARFSLFIADDDTVEEVKGVKAGIGYNRYSADTQFTDVALKLENHRSYVMATDGLFDQIGGPKRSGFGKARLRKFMQDRNAIRIVDQGDALKEVFAEYQGVEYRRDDLTVLGFRIPAL